MKFCLKLLLLFVAATMWTACSESTDSGDTIEMAIAASIDVVKDKKSLPTCSDELQGREYYVTSENAIYACINKSWVKTAKTNEWSSYTSTVCSTKPLSDSSGVQVICGDSVVAKIRNGKKGKTGAKGEKGEAGVNGADGAQGAQGDKGEKGVQGDKGATGKDGKDGTDGKNGADGDDCDAETLEDNSGLRILCGGDSVAVIKNGTDGKNGENGADGQKGPRGTDCQAFVSDDGDGVIQICDSMEIHIPNGSDGERGDNGRNGRNCYVNMDDDSNFWVNCSNENGTTEEMGRLWNGSNGSDGYDGSKGTDCYIEESSYSDAYQVYCNGNNIGELWNGRNGNDGENGVKGSDCFLETMEEGGLRVICGYDSVGSLWSGVNGKNGRNGVNGQSCSATPLEDGSGYSISCAGMSVGTISEKASWASMNPDAEYGLFMDSRDNQVYRMVKIGSQVWMAENLNFADSSKMPSLTGRIACYPDNKQNSCEIYGHHYTWAAAMDSANTGCGNGKSCKLDLPIQGACPDGWHVPSNDEWNQLTEYVGDDAGTKLKSIAFGGTDDYGFGIVATGNWGGGKSFSGDASSFADVWTSTVYDGDDIVYRYFGGSYVGEGNFSKSQGLVVRCIKDDDVFSSTTFLLNGKDGKNGKNGVDGENCTVTPLEDGSGYSIDCNRVGLASLTGKASWQFLNPEVNYGSFIDYRDNQIYKMVKIGDQVWMAENLNYADSVNYPSMKKRSRCYVDNVDSCAKYGRYYSWAAAMDSLNTGCGYGKNCSPTYPVQGVCPNGWHLPTKAEYETLIEFVDGRGNMLKSMNAGWPEASDNYGFSVAPTSGFDVTGEPYPYYWGVDVNVWSATQSSKTGAYFLYFVDYRNVAELWDGDGEKNIARSVRCLKDDSSFTNITIMTNGTDGKNGTNGVDGQNCTATVRDDGLGYIVSCGSVAAPSEEKTSWQYLVPDYDYSLFADERDKQVYKAVKIGKQVWMAENLNFADSTKYPGLLGGRSSCYDNSTANCDMYGRLYNWAAAVDSAGTYSTTAKGCGTGVLCSLDDKKVRGVCPQGWHLPSGNEWDELYAALGKSSVAMRSWKGWDGTKTSYFSVMPGGGIRGGYYSYAGSDAYIWSTKESDQDYAYFWYMEPYGYAGLIIGEDYDGKRDQMSVRCVKDNSSLPSLNDFLNGTDGTNGEDGKNGTSCVTMALEDGSGVKVVCDKDSVGVITNAAEGTYCAMIPLVEGSKDSRLVCGLKKGDVKPKAYYGTLVDERDGKVYKTLVVGSQTWMAENLNYDDSVKTKSLKGNSWCYDNSTANCDKYGRLYSWAASIDSVALYNEGDGVDCGNGKYCKQLPTKRGICPEGWHLPDTTEWRKLYANLGNSPYAMQEKGYYYWGNATNMSGFSALPAGWYAANNSGGRLGERTYYWSINDNSSTNAYIWLLHGSDSYLTTDPKNEGLSVRCVMD